LQRQVFPGRDYLVEQEKGVTRVLWLHVVGRLRPGVSLEQAKTDVNLQFRRLLEQQAQNGVAQSERQAFFNQRIEPSGAEKGSSRARAEYAEPLWVLSALVGIVLLIACSNVANLLLAKATGRQREIGIRLAIGAGRARLVRQLLTESIVLALLGGAAGFALAQWGSELLVKLASPEPGVLNVELRPDAAIFLFAAGLSMLTALLFGLVPAIRATGFNLIPALKESTVSGFGGRGSRLAKGLIVVQVAMCVVLLIGAGLFVRSLSKLSSVELGYDPNQLLLLRVDFASGGYKDQAVATAMSELAERFKRVPGVRSVAFSENGLFSGHDSGDEISISGLAPRPRNEMNARFDEVSPGYFETVGIPLKLGRTFTEKDTAGPPVAILNETMARFYFVNESPIGRTLTDEYPDNRVSFEIVGVVQDAKYQQVRETTPRRFYVPILGRKIPTDQAVYAVRYSGDGGAVASTLRQETEKLNSSISVVNSSTMNQAVARTLSRERLIAKLSLVFGALALVLAAVGLYGVTAYSVARRTREIGVRMALGARSSEVLRLVLSEVGLLLGLGTLIGVPAAAGLSRFVKARLYGVTTWDPVALLAAILIVAFCGLAAGLLPARRASRVDPMTALRWE
jgi:predicted permease